MGFIVNLFTLQQTNVIKTNAHITESTIYACVYVNYMHIGFNISAYKTVSGIY